MPIISTIMKVQWKAKINDEAYPRQHFKTIFFIRTGIYYDIPLIMFKIENTERKNFNSVFILL